ncbi:MAG: hypothetical protein ACYTG5_02000 [Planctomycetota bacterium]|jgi:hypothetical protein
MDPVRKFLLSLAVLAGSLAGQRGLGRLYQENLPSGSVNLIAVIEAETGFGHDSCLGVARTPDGHYFVSTRRSLTSGQHKYYEFDSAGALVARHDQPSANFNDPEGYLDLAWDGQTGLGSMLWAGMTGSTLQGFNWQLGIFDSAAQVTLEDFDGVRVSCLAIAELEGSPIFVSSDSCPPSSANEVRIPGSPVHYHAFDGSTLQDRTPDPTPDVIESTLACRPDQIPEGKFGAAYDPLSQTVWWHVDARHDNPNPNGSLTRFFATDLEGNATGMVFQGDRAIGGVANGCEFYVDAFGNGVMVYLVGSDENRNKRGETMVEVYGRFAYGETCSGRIGFDGECFLGRQDWGMSLSEVPDGHAGVAVLWRGAGLFPPGIPATPGLNNCALNIEFRQTMGVANIVDGQANWPLRVPSSSSLLGFEAAFQWLVPGSPDLLPLDLSRAGSVRIGANF